MNLVEVILDDRLGGFEYLWGGFCHQRRLALHDSLFEPKLKKDTVQSSCRSLMVDTLPIPKQQLGSAWGEFLPFVRSVIPMLRS